MLSEFTLRRSPVSCLLFALVLVGFAATQASADSVAYNVSGNFGSGSSAQYFGGQITWDTSSNRVTGYTLGLGNTSLSCSGSCTAVLKTFSGSGYSGLLAGFFNPNGSPFTLTLWNSSGLQLMTTDMSWSAVSVPEASAIAQLLCVLVVLAFMIPRSPILKRAN
jgi:hypothetical protein